MQKGEVSALRRSFVFSDLRPGIRLALQQGQTVGSEKFKDAMSVAGGVRRTQSRRGRPVKASNNVIEKLDQTDFGF